MSEIEREEIATLEAPYMRKVQLEEARFESGMKMFRVIIREGKRITQIDLDAETAGEWARIMGNWATDQGGQG
ncbi:MAG: hypothetical protein H6888_07800 [Nitratireductor sp.]|nr:hypothetical protein [Nitratireductor sp.]MCC0020966.1 hypothetical protein [Nitratireductor sp.]